MQAPLTAVGKACLFALVWTVVTAIGLFSMRGMFRTQGDLLLGALFALLLSYFPIMVATDIGYRTARKASRSKSIKRPPIANAPDGSSGDPEMPSLGAN